MILIIAAMQEELIELKKLGENTEDKVFKNIQYVEMTLDGKDVMLALSGVGKINASYTASILASHFNPELIINIGSAGGLHKHQEIGDIVIADVVQSHDLDIGENTHIDTRFIYPSNKKYNDLLEKTIQNLGFNYDRGLIVSGDQFVVYDSYSHKRIQKYQPEAICVEMEATAIGAISHALKIPFVVIRGISDIPYKKGNEMDFETYLSLAAQNSATITKAYIQALKNLQD